MSPYRCILLSMVQLASLAGCTVTPERDAALPDDRNNAEMEESAMQEKTTWSPTDPTNSQRTQIARNAYQELVGGAALPLYRTDPEFADIMNNFIYGDIYQKGDKLSTRQRQLISLVSLVAQQSMGLLELQAQAALRAGLTPVEIKEAVYQCAPYVGFPRAVDALDVVNGVFAANGITLPLEAQATVDENTRFDFGLDAQAAIFGEGMRQIAEVGSENMAASSYYLVTNCFGDYYTRDGIDLQTRELLTLTILCNLGTESQIKSHIMGNVNMGRDRELISDAIYQCLPFMGYPRMLNALGFLDEVLPEQVADRDDTADFE